jgi:hypothetical protein
MLTEIRTPKVAESVTLASGFSILRKVEHLNAFLMRSGPDYRLRSDFEGASRTR